MRVNYNISIFYKSLVFQKLSFTCNVCNKKNKILTKDFQNQLDSFYISGFFVVDYDIHPATCANY